MKPITKIIFQHNMHFIKIPHLITCIILILYCYVCLTVKSGECPNTEGMNGICVEQCTADDSCEGEQKCCSNGCGHTCMAPVPVGEC